MVATYLRMTVARLRAEMTHAEFVLWTRYLARRAQQRELAAKMGR